MATQSLETRDPAWFLARRGQLLADGGLRGSAFGEAYACVVDEWLGALWTEAVGQAALGQAGSRGRGRAGSEGMALVAVGGYGRRDLCPHSDLDVVLVHRGVRGVREVAERLWYPIWDTRVGLDHSVRTLKEILAVADDDLRAALGLLESRLVVGEDGLVAELHERVGRLWERRARRFVGELGQAAAARQAAAGEVAFLLEPDLKDGKGGLRDVQALRTAARFTPVIPTEPEAIGDAAETLLAVRVELQRATGRATDRLLLQEQDVVASALGLEDADELMARVAEAARAVTVFGDDAWARVRSWLAGPRGRVAPRDRPLGPGLLLREGEVELDGPVDATDGSLILRAAAAAAQLGTSLSRRAMAGLSSEACGPGDPWPEEARRALVSLLGAGRNAIAVQEALDQHGLLVRVLPEWQAVRCRPQRNAYHRFTVDRHLLEAAALSAEFVREVGRPDLLLVGAWLHDLGKGFPGDHTDTGVVLMGRVAARMGFSAEDTAMLVGLVRHHLLLADTATRRDPADPKTATAVAEALGSRGMLELLEALTEADSRATGPTAWSPWKESLIRDLVSRVERVLAGDEAPPRPTGPAPEQAELIRAAAGGILVRGSGDQLTVVAPDRPGLFCLVAGVLALEGLDVLSADAWSSEDGTAVEVLRVDRSTGPGPLAGAAPDWSRVAQSVGAALSQPDALEARLARRASIYAPSGRPTAARAASPRVVTDNEASTTATVVEVWVANAIGVLYRVTRALAREGLDIRHAKVLTLGHEVVDSFYVIDQSRGKL
ncbi:MAG: [protein-PII] uridylyltransferase, partial [Acidimicrobiales bacterium]|nr:[protein-PII] uridylyltransferase [Acidimicrobiales bacterium]